ncbi:MAG: hypothetical protein PHQ18_04165 [Patescibacteria group bacterium]|nr:hypothetical protein [Patescibacteria group bacterium]
MKKLLIATRNQDKYKIIIALIEKVFPNHFTFESLADTNITYDIVEEGSILERAEQKAKEFWNCLNNQQKKDFFATIGVDDGFAISEEDLGDPNSKELTDQILSGSLVKENDFIWVKRGIALYNNTVLKSCMTSIPFIFLGNPNKVLREEGRFKSSYVLGAINTKILVQKMKFDDSINYYLKYCEEDLKHLFIL